MVPFVAAAFFKGFLKGMRALFMPPFLWITLTVAVLGMGYWHHTNLVEQAYEQGYAKGEADTKAKIKKQREAEEARNASIKAEDERKQKLIVADIQGKLEAAEKKLTERVKVIFREVPKYVTQKADAGATITAGFVYLHNLSTNPTDHEVAGSKPEDVDAPTGITLSEVARVDAENYAECQLRKEVIDGWIEWYNLNKSLWEESVKAQSERVPIH